LDRFVRELAYVEFGEGGSGKAKVGSKSAEETLPPSAFPLPTSAIRDERYHAIQSLAYNDLAADRQTVAAVQALEAILARHAAGEPDCVVRINDPKGGLVLYRPGKSEPAVLYEGAV
jgi:hypothetical protein